MSFKVQKAKIRAIAFCEYFSPCLVRSCRQPSQTSPEPLARLEWKRRIYLRGLCVSHCTRSVYRALSASAPRPSPGSCRINSAHSRFMSGIDSPSVRTPSPCPREDDPLQNHTSVIMFSYCCVLRVVWRKTTELILRRTYRHCSSINAIPPYG